jgi:hypothetical protein
MSLDYGSGRKHQRHDLDPIEIAFLPKVSGEIN